jgi:hypothetical protein
MNKGAVLGKVMFLEVRKNWHEENNLDGWKLNNSWMVESWQSWDLIKSVQKIAEISFVSNSNYCLIIPVRVMFQV